MPPHCLIPAPGVPEQRSGPTGATRTEKAALRFTDEARMRASLAHRPGRWLTTATLARWAGLPVARAFRALVLVKVASEGLVLRRCWGRGRTQAWKLSKGVQP